MGPKGTAPCPAIAYSKKWDVPRSALVTDSDAPAEPSGVRCNQQLGVLDADQHARRIAGHVLKQRRRRGDVARAGPHRAVQLLLLHEKGGREWKN